MTHCVLGKPRLCVPPPFVLVHQPASELAALAGHHVLIINGASSTPLSKVTFFSWDSFFCLALVCQEKNGKIITFEGTVPLAFDN